MGTFIAFGLTILIGWLLLELAFRALGAGVRDAAWGIRGIVTLYQGALRGAKTRTARVEMAILVTLFLLGAASAVLLALRWLFT